MQKDAYEDREEWETRPIYDLVKIDIFKKYQATNIILTNLRQNRTTRNVTVYQNAIMLLFDTLRPHMIKRTKKLPKEIEWLDQYSSGIPPQKNPETLEKWVNAHKTLGRELMNMGVLNIHDVSEPEEREYARK